MRPNQLAGTGSLQTEWGSLGVPSGNPGAGWPAPVTCQELSDLGHVAWPFCASVSLSTTHPATHLWLLAPWHASGNKKPL